VTRWRYSLTAFALVSLGLFGRRLFRLHLGPLAHERPMSCRHAAGRRWCTCPMADNQANALPTTTSGRHSSSW